MRRMRDAAPLTRLSSAARKLKSRSCIAWPRSYVAGWLLVRACRCRLGHSYRSYRQAPCSRDVMLQSKPRASTLCSFVVCDVGWLLFLPLQPFPSLTRNDSRHTCVFLSVVVCMCVLASYPPPPPVIRAIFHATIFFCSLLLPPQKVGGGPGGVRAGC